MRTSRIEAFSDGVFAIAITLLVLEIRPPESMDRLGHDLLGLWSSYLAYVISFLLIGLVWANHHRMFDDIARADRVLMFLNTLLLMNVAFLPFVTAVLAGALRADSHGAQRIAVALYGGSLVVGGLFFNAVWQRALTGGLLADSVDVEVARRAGRRFLLGPLLYLVGTLLGWIWPAAGLTVFALLIVFYWLPGRGTSSDTGSGAGPEPA